VFRPSLDLELKRGGTVGFKRSLDSWQRDRVLSESSNNEGRKQKKGAPWPELRNSLASGALKIHTAQAVLFENRERSNTLSSLTCQSKRKKSPNLRASGKGVQRNPARPTECSEEAPGALCCMRFCSDVEKNERGIWGPVVKKMSKTGRGFGSE